MSSRCTSTAPNFETLTYRVSFGEAGLGRTTGACKLHALTGDERARHSATGELVLEGRTGEPASAGGVRMWAGRIADSFYIDLSLLANVNGAVKNGTAVEPFALAPGERQEQLRRHDGRHRSCSRSRTSIPNCKPGARIGLWCATKLATDAGGWRQINRGGYPMMWPIFWPDDVHFTNPADTRHPSEDFAAEGAHIASTSPPSSRPAGPRPTRKATAQTVARELFPDVLPYVVGTPATFGFATRNGRTLADNAPEVMMSLVAGTAIPSGLKPSVAKNQRADKFPYVVPA